MAAWWGTRSNVSARLRIEVAAMRASFGENFRLNVPNDSKPLFWTGMVEINLSNLRQREHELKILYPSDYPNRPAEAYVLKPHVYSEKHQYEDGQLCLFNPKDGEHYGWNPSASTAVTITGWAIQWLYAFYTWKATGEWPGIEERVTDDLRQPPRGRR
jgi:ubiquitin-protein ligase